MFDRVLCTRQLRYSGMMETIRIRRAGYPIRHTFEQFIKRYRLLDPSVPAAGQADDKATSIRLAKSVLGEGVSGLDWQVGHTKIFLKDAHDQQLELAREAMFNEKAIVVQRFLRGAFSRRRFSKMRDAMVTIQRHYRTFMAKERYTKLFKGFTRLQVGFIFSKYLRCCCLSQSLVRASSYF